jgi:hypothetical protein
MEVPTSVKRISSAVGRFEWNLAVLALPKISKLSVINEADRFNSPRLHLPSRKNCATADFASLVHHDVKAMPTIRHFARRQMSAGASRQWHKV